MVTMAEIEALGRQVGEQYHAERLILFGSYARGVVTEDSDVDLLVVIPFDGHRANQSGAIRSSLRPKFPIDLVLRTPAEVDYRLASRHSFMTELLRGGRLLCGA
jgi:predicted nucleotidyltransferase